MTRNLLLAAAILCALSSDALAGPSEEMLTADLSPQELAPDSLQALLGRYLRSDTKTAAPDG